MQHILQHRHFSSLRIFILFIYLFSLENNTQAQCVSIGQSLQGGIVFWVDATGDGGLIAAPSDQSSGCNWGCQGTLITGTFSNSNGSSNTDLIYAQCSVPGMSSEICSNLVLGGYSDWYLPSIDELNLLYQQKSIVGGFTANAYWTSNQFSSVDAYWQNFNSGMQGHNLKNQSAGVRAIRAFSNACCDTGCYWQLGGNGADAISGTNKNIIGINTSSTLPLRIYTNGSEKMTITGSDGKIGIGKTNPTFQLDVKTNSGLNDDGIAVENASGKSAEIKLRANSTGGRIYSLRCQGSNNSQPGAFGIYDYNIIKYRFLIDSLGNVGIGTNTTKPGNRLEVNSEVAGQSGLRMTQLTANSSASNSNGKVLSVDANGDVILTTCCATSTNDWSRNTGTSTLYPSAMSGASYTDRVALGTNSVHSTSLQRDARLMVNGGDIIVQEDMSNNTSGPDNGADIWLLDNNGKGLDLFGQDGKAEIASVGNGTGLYFTSDGAYHGMIMHGDAGNQGKVQIGNVTTPGNYKLYVENGILTEKVKVAIKSTAFWADYVFTPQHTLRNLYDVEKYIQQHQHLPGIESATTLVQEGLDLGAMQAKQMEKIEELTLYLIDMKKQLDQLQQQNNELKAIVNNPTLK
jgi:hypothetical protein